MNSRKMIVQQTLTVAVGIVICAVAMVGVFVLLGCYDLSVLLGAAVGSVIAAGNFFVMALCTDLAADKAQQEDVKGGQALLQFSYIGRMIGMFLLWFLCYQTGLFNIIALVVPTLFVQPVITVTEIFRKAGEKKA